MEDTSTSKPMKKDPHEVEKEEREAIRLRHTPLAGDTVEEGNIMALELLPGE